MNKQQGVGGLISAEDKQTIRCPGRVDQTTKTTAGILEERKKVRIVPRHMQNLGQVRCNLMSGETERGTVRVN